MLNDLKDLWVQRRWAVDIEVDGSHGRQHVVCLMIIPWCSTWRGVTQLWRYPAY